MNQAIDPALVAARIATYGLALWLFGSATFRALIARTPAHPPGVLVRIAAPAALALAALGYLTLLAREVSGAPGWPDPAVVAQLCAGTGFGAALSVTGGAAITLALAGLLVGGRWIRLALSATALAALAFVGHAADGEGPAGWARLALMATHLLAVGAWLGALPALATALCDKDAAPDLLRRFGVLGAVAVTAVLASGLASLGFVVADTHRGLGPVYLRVLLIKLALVLGLLGLAAINRFRLTPQIATRPGRALPALRRTILLEQALGLGAIVAVAALGQLDPSM